MPNNDPPITYLDTTVFLWYFNKPRAVDAVTLEEAQERQVVARTLLEEAQQNKRKILTSIYTKIEVAFIDEEKSIKKLDPEAPAKMDALLNNISIVSLLNVSDSIAVKARDIVRMTAVSDTKTIKPKDAVHVASALIYGASELFTHDDGMCKWDYRIEGLRICQPYLMQKPMF